MFYKHFLSNAITKSNDLIRRLLSIIYTLLVEKIMLRNQTIENSKSKKKKILENTGKHTRNRPILPSIRLSVYL